MSGEYLQASEANHKNQKIKTPEFRVQKKVVNYYKFYKLASTIRMFK